MELESTPLDHSGTSAPDRGSDCQQLAGKFRDAKSVFPVVNVPNFLGWKCVNQFFVTIMPQVILVHHCHCCSVCTSSSSGPPYMPDPQDPLQRRRALYSTPTSSPRAVGYPSRHRHALCSNRYGGPLLCTLHLTLPWRAVQHPIHRRPSAVQLPEQRCTAEQDRRALYSTSYHVDLWCTVPLTAVSHGVQYPAQRGRALSSTFNAHHALYSTPLLMYSTPQSCTAPLLTSSHAGQQRYCGP